MEQRGNVVLDIPAMQGTVQVVMRLDTLESVLTQFPSLEVYPVAHAPGDLPTYAFRVKAEHKVPPLPKHPPHKKEGPVA